jgi:cytoskeletal protein CcmA (bactofilin family)
MKNWLSTNSIGAERPPNPEAQNANANTGAPPPPSLVIESTSSLTSEKAGAFMASVISKTLKITGELESSEDIQIEGQIDGDVHGMGVKIGPDAKIKGTVHCEQVELAGTIEGRIESKKVILSGTARVTGDILYQDIKIESGAYISGNLKPDFEKPELKPAMKPAAATAPSPASTGNASAQRPPS